MADPDHTLTKKKIHCFIKYLLHEISYQNIRKQQNFKIII